MKNEDHDESQFMIIIVGRKQKETLVSALSAKGIKIINVVFARGSVSTSYFRSIFNFTPEYKKTVITCIIKNSKVQEIMELLREEFQFDKPNTGIAFTISIGDLSF